MFVKVKDDRIINMASIKSVNLGPSNFMTDGTEIFCLHIHYLDRTSETIRYGSGAEAQWVFNDITNFER